MNKAPNPSQLNSRQEVFIKHFADPSSDTYLNAYQSALKSGYSEGYAKSITSQAPWLSKTINKKSLLEKAKAVLDQSLDFSDKDNPVGAARIRFDAAKFIASSDDEFSQKTQSHIEHDVTQNAFDKIGELLKQYK